MTRKLLQKYDTVWIPSSGVTLKELTNKMANKIDAVLFGDEVYIEYKSYESDSEYNARLRREEHIAKIRDNPEFLEYLKLHERFKYYVEER
jgi:hypothetical protein